MGLFILNDNYPKQFEIIFYLTQYTYAKITKDVYSDYNFLTKNNEES